jgi:hypothetical protein
VYGSELHIASFTFFWSCHVLHIPDPTGVCTSQSVLLIILRKNYNIKLEPRDFARIVDMSRWREAIKRGKIGGGMVSQAYVYVMENWLCRRWQAHCKGYAGLQRRFGWDKVFLLPISWSGAVLFCTGQEDSPQKLPRIPPTTVAPARGRVDRAKQFTLNRGNASVSVTSLLMDDRIPGILLRYSLPKQSLFVGCISNEDFNAPSHAMKDKL